WVRYNAAMRWTLADIPWEKFDRAKVDREILRLVKAASLVERNGEDYARYLCGVFEGDAVFQAAARKWGVEEVQHGEALGRWAMLRPVLRPRRGLRPLHRGIPRRSERRRLGPRLARRRAGRALHRRDRHELLLHRACRGERRAGAASHLPAHRRGRAAPLQIVPNPSRALSGARGLGLLGEARRRLGPHSRIRGRRARLRLPRRQPSRALL